MIITNAIVEIDKQPTNIAIVIIQDQKRIFFIFSFIVLLFLYLKHTRESNPNNEPTMFIVCMPNQ